MSLSRGKSTTRFFGGHRFSEEKWQCSLDVKQQHTFYRRKATKKSLRSALQTIIVILPKLKKTIQQPQHHNHNNNSNTIWGARHAALFPRRRKRAGARGLAALLAVSGPHERVPRRIVEQIVDSAPVVPLLHAPELQLVDSVGEVLKILEKLVPDVEQVIDVPMIFPEDYRIRTFRSSLQEPQMAEQLGAVPVIEHVRVAPGSGA